MPRKEGRFKTSIWMDEEFIDLSATEKLVYMTIVTQPKLNLCGVISYTPAAWADKLKLTKSAVHKAVLALEATWFVQLDPKTEELWVRTLTKNDGILGKPYMIVAMSKDFSTIHSPLIRDKFLEGLGQRFILDLLVRFPNAFGLESQQELDAPFVDAFHRRFDG